jgi:hypothetical protein
LKIALTGFTVIFLPSIAFASKSFQSNVSAQAFQIHQCTFQSIHGHLTDVHTLEALQFIALHYKNNHIINKLAKYKTAEWDPSSIKILIRGIITLPIQQLQVITSGNSAI